MTSINTRTFEQAAAVTPANKLGLRKRGHVVSCKCADHTALEARAFTTDSYPTGITCTQAFGTDVAITMEPAEDYANTYICTGQTPAPISDFGLNAASGTAAPSLRSSLNIGTVATNMLDQQFISGPSGLFGILFLMALGSTLWYRRKYHQALATYQQGAVESKLTVY